MIYKDITKEKERRIWKRNCCITLFRKSISNAGERGENPGLVSERDLGSEGDGHTVTLYLPKVFPEPLDRRARERARLHLRAWAWGRPGDRKGPGRTAPVQPASGRVVTKRTALKRKRGSGVPGVWQRCPEPDLRQRSKPQADGLRKRHRARAVACPLAASPPLLLSQRILQGTHDGAG